MAPREFKHEEVDTDKDKNMLVGRKECAEAPASSRDLLLY
jgi:hypothetical protein